MGVETGGDRDENRLGTTWGQGWGWMGTGKGTGMGMDTEWVGMDGVQDRLGII